MFKAKISKIGNSIGLIIPSIEVDYSKWEEGDWVEVELKKIKKEGNQNDMVDNS